MVLKQSSERDRPAGFSSPERDSPHFAGFLPGSGRYRIVANRPGGEMGTVPWGAIARVHLYNTSCARFDGLRSEHEGARKRGCFEPIATGVARASRLCVHLRDAGATRASEMGAWPVLSFLRCFWGGFVVGLGREGIPAGGGTRRDSRPSAVITPRRGLPPASVRTCLAHNEERPP